MAFRKSGRPAIGSGMMRSSINIVSRKYGGSSDRVTLAWACIRYSACKVSDVSSIDANTGALVALFHARSQRWCGHFELRDHIVVPFTPVGAVSVRVLRLNSDQRIAEWRAPA